MEELIGELKRQGVLRSPHAEAAFRAIDRKDFVRQENAGEAYGNYPLPIGYGQTISQPYTVAFMLDLLDPKSGERILDVGSGSGWTTALLGHMVAQEGGKQKFGKVFAIERIVDLCRFGEANVAKYNFVKGGIVQFICGDAAKGLSPHAPFDKILSSASARDIPHAWKEEVRPGGAIVAPVESSIWRFTKTSATEWQKEEFPGFAFVPLIESSEQ